MPDDFPPEAGRILSAMLRAAAGLSLLCVPMLLLQGGGALIAGGLPAKGCFVGGLLLDAYSLWLCLRLRLDARLFADLAAGRLSEVVLDETLAQFLNSPPRTRNMADRLAGTRRLCLRLLVAAVLSLGCFAFGVAAGVM